jgi:hypothetical protein
VTALAVALGVGRVAPGLDEGATGVAPGLLTVALVLAN